MSGITYVRGDATVPSVKGVKVIAGWGRQLGASVHMPGIGCGLAGGKWSRVEPLGQERLARRGIRVTVYDHGD
ncbi:hypothetical protein AB0G20_13345 [Streptomyces sp. NPDC024017]|uniref:hypothetical protein n=1 Tax=Streptomyces sp. NPDC024017 TaxID=3154326 RepID=UPI0033E4609F